MTLPHRPRLSRSLREQSTRLPQRGDEARSSDFGTWVSRVPAILAGLFAVTYGGLRPANESFYTSLGLTPEDLGVTESTLIARAAAYVGVAAALGMALLAFFLLGIRLGQFIREVFDAHHKVRAIGFVAILLGVQALLFNLAEAPNIGVSVFISCNCALLTGMYWSGTETPWSSRHLIVRPGRRKMPQSRTRTAVLLAVAATFTVSSVVVLEFWDKASSCGEYLLMGGSLSSSDSLTSGLLAVHTSPARLISLKPNDDYHVCDGKKVPLLLGSSGGFSIIISYPGYVPIILDLSPSLSILTQACAAWFSGFPRATTA